MKTFRPTPVQAAVAVCLLLAFGLLAVVDLGSDRVRITASFTSAVGVYEGSEVRLMGVPVGEVIKVTPRADHVEVELEYDSAYELDANAQAVVISPSMIADRFIQLAPVHTEGDVLADGARIPLERTGVPVELDRVYEASHELVTALGPHGANRNGSLNRLLAVGADNLDGQGGSMNRMITALGGAMTTLGASGDDFFSSLDHLAVFSGALAENDRDVRVFNRKFATIAGFLSDERQNLSALLRQLARAFGTIETFVSKNRKLLADNVTGLVGVTRALANERESLVALTELTPVGLNNLNRTWDPVAQAVRSRSNQAEVLRDLGGVICDAFRKQGVPEPALACSALKTLLTETSR